MIEIIRTGVNADRARVVLFDFDGTISTIRSGWMEVMIPMMVEILAETKSGETDEQLRLVVEEFVGRLTGKQTMYQMIELAENVAKRGGTPEDPVAYKRRYLDLLWHKIEHRIEELRQGASPEKYLVPGSRELLENLRDRGYKMYLASGTDEVYMKEEARLLDVTKYFAGVHGAILTPSPFELAASRTGWWEAGIRCGGLGAARLLTCPRRPWPDASSC